MPALHIDVNGVDRIVASVDRRIAGLKAIDTILAEASGVIYGGTKLWHDTKGEGSWPKLAEATVAKKTSQGLGEPERPLYAEGNLYESVTSPFGPYSYMIPMFDGVIIGVVWTPAKALAAGTRTSGAGHHTTIPARPIWPPPTSSIGIAMMRRIGEIILHNVPKKA